MRDIGPTDLAAQSVVIVNDKGLHARASAKFARLASEYPADITVHHEGISANARSIMDLLLLAAHRGCEIRLEARGEQAAEAVTALSAMVVNGFGELEEDAARASAPRGET